MARIRKPAAERKEQILNTALKLFSSIGYNSVIMDDIAKACDLARTTLYEYYSNKEDILIALAEQIALNVREMQIKGDTCRKQLENFAADSMHMIQKNRLIYSILFQATPVMSEKLSSNILNWREQNHNQVKEIIKRGKQSSEFRDYISADDAVFAFQALLGQRSGDLLLKNEEVDPAAEANRLINILWMGIGR
jgi:AcrR family transcriptional regulator